MKKLLKAAIVIATSIIFIGCVNNQLSNKIVKASSDSWHDVYTSETLEANSNVFQLINKADAKHPVYLNYMNGQPGQSPLGSIYCKLLSFSHDLSSNKQVATNIPLISIFDTLNFGENIYCLNMSPAPDKKSSIEKFMMSTINHTVWKNLTKFSDSQNINYSFIKSVDGKIVTLYTLDGYLYYKEYNSASDKWSNAIQIYPKEKMEYFKMFDPTVINNNLYAIGSHWNDKNIQILDFNVSTKEAKFIKTNASENAVRSSTIASHNGELYFAYFSGSYFSGGNIFIQKYKNDNPVESIISLPVKENCHYFNMALDNNNNIYLGYYNQSSENYVVQKYTVTSKSWRDITPTFFINNKFKVNNLDYPKLGYNSVLNVIDLAYFDHKNHQVHLETLKL